MTQSARFILAVLVLGGLLSAVRARQPEPADQADAISQARSYSEAGQYEQVIAVLEPLQTDQADYEVHRLLGSAYRRLDRLPEARRAYQAAIRVRPMDAQLRYLLGDVHLAQGKFALAAEAYAAARRLGLDTPELHYKTALACYHLEDYVGLTETRTVMGGLSGRIQDGCYLIEPVPGQRDRFFVAAKGSAIYHLQRALEGGLDTPRVRLLEADIWLGARRYDRALAIYRRIEAAIPAEDRARYYYQFSQACLGTDDVEGGVDRLQRAVALDRAAYDRYLLGTYRRVADHYNAQGDLDNYIRHLKLAAEESPDSADLHYLLGNALYEAGRKAEATHHWRLTLELDPDHPDRRRMLELIRMINAGR